jgi:hypothetical protein
MGNHAKVAEMLLNHKADVHHRDKVNSLLHVNVLCSIVYGKLLDERAPLRYNYAAFTVYWRNVSSMFMIVTL